MEMPSCFTRHVMWPYASQTTSECSLNDQDTFDPITQDAFVHFVSHKMEDEGTFPLLATWPRCIKAGNYSPVRRLFNISGATLATVLCHWPLMLTCSFFPCSFHSILFSYHRPTHANGGPSLRSHPVPSVPLCLRHTGKLYNSIRQFSARYAKIENGLYRYI